MKNKIIITAFGLCSMFFTTSCNDWLDVIPQAQVSSDKIFSTPEGYESVLRGIYISMTEPNAYGKQSTFGLMDVLAQYYTVFSNKHHELYEASVYNYQNDNSRRAIDAMWLNHYNSIANCNILLEYMEGKDDLFFEGNQRNKIAGEVIAIRAYLHFDLLRAFALNYQTNPETMGIPYAESFYQKIHKQLKSSEVLDKVIADLNKAKELLAFTKDAEELNRHRFNYYSVVALLARTYDYYGKKAEALACAKEIIENVSLDGESSKKYSFTPERYFTAALKDRDVTTRSEQIFSLASNDVKNTFYYADADLSTAFVLLEPENIYTDPDDFRKHLYGKSEGSGKVVSYKYYKVPGTNGYEGDIPMLHISEMYLLAAVNSFDTNPEEAAGYLQTLRKMRGASQKVNGQTYQGLLKELTLEARREFLGEGQLFYWYKRHNLPIERQGASITLTKEQSCLPMPANEIEFGNRIEDYLK